MTLGEDGDLVSAQVFLKNLAPTLQIAIQRVAAADAIEDIEKVFDEDPVKLVAKSLRKRMWSHSLRSGFPAFCDGRRATQPRSARMRTRWARAPVETL